MTEEEFRAEMQKKGWDEEEIQEYIADSKKEIALPLETILVLAGDKPKIRNYHINAEGYIVDD